MPLLWQWHAHSNTNNGGNDQQNNKDAECLTVLGQHMAMVIWGKRQTDNPSCSSMSVNFPVRLLIIHFKRDVVEVRTINQGEGCSSQLIIRAHLDVTNQSCLSDLVQNDQSDVAWSHSHKDNAKTLGRMTRIHSETMTDDVTRGPLKASNLNCTSSNRERVNNWWVE
jgi:hypothetical protein